MKQRRREREGEAGQKTKGIQKKETKRRAKARDTARRRWQETTQRRPTSRAPDAHLRRLEDVLLAVSPSASASDLLMVRPSSGSHPRSQQLDLSRNPAHSCSLAHNRSLRPCPQHLHLFDPALILSMLRHPDHLPL